MSEQKSLLEKLKELFSLSRVSRPAADSESTPKQGSTITVEREPNTASEDAVKGTETAAEPADGSDERADVVTDDGSDAEVEAVTDNSSDERVETATDDSSDKGAETMTDDGREVGAVTDDGSDEDVKTTTDDDSETPENAGSGEPVDELRGIGPTYADRLGEVGISTVGDLAAADAEAVADAAQTSESRAGDWIERAKNFS